MRRVSSVAMFQRHGNALGLNRRRRGVTAVGHRFEDFWGKAQAFKAGRHFSRSNWIINNFAGSGFRAGDRNLGRSTLLKRGADAAPKSGKARIGRRLLQAPT